MKTYLIQYSKLEVFNVLKEVSVEASSEEEAIEYFGENVERLDGEASIEHMEFIEEYADIDILNTKET